MAADGGTTETRQPIRGGPDIAVLEIDLGIIAANWAMLRARHGGPVAAVLKADAYGLGAPQIARTLFDAGCRHFFTAHVPEAVILRPLLPGAMLATLNGLPPGSEAACVEHAIDPVLGSLDETRRWSAMARHLGRALPALLHIDTGMSRLGLDRDELATLIGDTRILTGISLRYVLTHLISGEIATDPLNVLQLRRFDEACAALPPAPRSIANSAGIFLGPAFASDLARAGGALYGLNPTPLRPNPMGQPARLRARVLHIRQIEAGESVGYNATWRAARPSRIATIGLGYADGYPRGLSNRGRAIPVRCGSGRPGFDGAAVPLVGRISMDLTTFDVTDQPSIRAGDWLEVLGPGLTADDLGAAAGTNGYEILTSLGSRTVRAWRA